MADATIRFFPVGNGDCTLLWVGETRILVDLSPRILKGDPHYDVDETREALLPLVKRDDGRYVVEAFSLTHPDKDHLLYAEELLHLGAPDDYDPTSEKILVEEIIYVPASFDELDQELSADGEAMQREIDRRLGCDGTAGNLVSALLRAKDVTPGADRTFSVGDFIDSFGASTSDPRLSARVYGPRATPDPQCRNDLSSIMQFRVTPAGSVSPVRIMLGGDAPWEAWEDIHDNEDLEEFTYDLMLAPHHCSWSAFAESSEEEASKKVVEVFKHKQDQAKVVASSLAINIDRTPPSEKAADIYKDIVGQSNFYCTGEYPTEGDLQPIVFEISSDGVLPPETKDREIESAAAATLIRRTPQKYGSSR